MIKKIKKIEYEGESFLLPCPIDVDIEELKKKFYESQDLFVFLLAKSISELTKRKKGEWTKIGDRAYRCSVCNDVSCCMGDYCPDCGADMRGGKDERAMG